MRTVIHQFFFFNLKQTICKQIYLAHRWEPSRYYYTLSQSRPGINGHEGVFHTSQSSRTGYSSLYWIFISNILWTVIIIYSLVTYPGYFLWGGGPERFLTFCRKFNLSFLRSDGLFGEIIFNLSKRLFVLSLEKCRFLILTADAFYIRHNQFIFT